MRDANEEEKNLFAADLIEIIHHSKIFAEIDRSACESLLPRLERVILDQAEVLFEQNDPSDCLYILIDGQLTAMLLTTEGKYKVVGTVDKGETVGELGVLSNQPRSLTIRASTTCKLLKLPRKQFEDFCKEQPKFMARVIDLIVTRSQNTLKVISQKKLYQHIAIVAANYRTPLTAFMRKLNENLVDHFKYILLETMPEGHTISELMEQAEHDNKALIFELNEENLSGLQNKLNHVGGIYIVADGDIPSLLSEFAINMLDRYLTPFALQYDLVLLHDEHVLMPSGTREWLRQADFTLHHHIRSNEDKDYQRLIRFMMGKPIGVVFGGGGHKGWACVGTIKALLEANIPIDAIGGTSVGALVAACYARHLNYEDTFNSFKILSHAVRNPLALKHLTWPIISLISSKDGTEALFKVFDDIDVEDLWLPFFCLSSNLTAWRESIHRHGPLWERLRSTAAIPGVVSPMVLDGELHYDGGLLNNLPVDVMRAMLGDECITFAVSLSGLTNKKKYYFFPPIIPFWMALMKKFGFGYKEYKFPPFFNTFSNALLLGSSAKEKSNQLMADILIAPDLSQFKVLRLHKHGVAAMVDAGYYETKNQIKASVLFS